MIDVKAKIISNEKIAQDFFKITLEAPEIAKAAKAGQFVMVRCSNGTDPLLRRALSFHRISKNECELLYQVVGKGTEILSMRKKGEVLPVLGPLGNGFDVRHKLQVTGHELLLAGGMGVAPLLELAKQVMGHESRVTVYIGAKTKSHILCEDEFLKLGAEVHIATEDGSKGHKGLVTDFVFTGKGWGHGVGLCQVGAYGMAQTGAGYKDILKKYYTGIKIGTIY